MRSSYLSSGLLDHPQRDKEDRAQIQGLVVTANRASPFSAVFLKMM